MLLREVESSAFDRVQDKNIYREIDIKEPPNESVFLCILRASAFESDVEIWKGNIIGRVWLTFCSRL